MTNHHYAIILAGGIGSRFWPLSRLRKPKQFLDILGLGETFIQSTFSRLALVFPVENIYVVAHTDYEQIIKEQLPALPPGNILLEPERKNTTAAVALAAHKLQAMDPEAVLLIAPSDHYIAQVEPYLNILKTALAEAQQDELITIGITPTRPDTGYGYIQYDKESNDNGFHKVIRFTEKPVLERALEFIASGDYLWNSGMFVWKAENVIKALKAHCPEIDRLFQVNTWNTNAERESIRAIYKKCPAISIDYCLMEKADNIYLIQGNFGWSDVGTWASLHQVSKKTHEKNVYSGTNIYIEDCSDCIIKSDEDKATVIKGLKDYIVINTKDALLIYPKSQEQEIHNVLNHVKNQIGEAYL